MIVSPLANNVVSATFIIELIGNPLWKVNRRPLGGATDNIPSG
jgi:hypothetical protein